MTRPLIAEVDIDAAIDAIEKAVETVGGEYDMEGLDRIAGQLLVSPAAWRCFMEIQPEDGEHLPIMARVYGAFLAGVTATDSAHERARGAAY